VEKPRRLADAFGELSTDQLRAYRDEAATAERQAAGARERVRHRKRRHAADVELRLRAEGTVPMPDLLRAALLALTMTVALLAFAGYLASSVDGASALFGLLGLPFGAAAARLIRHSTSAFAAVVTVTGVVALLAEASRQTALLIAVSTAAGLWYDALLVPFVMGLAIIVRRDRGRVS
jgi:hypothetical protein